MVFPYQKINVRRSQVFTRLVCALLWLNFKLESWLFFLFFVFLAETTIKFKSESCGRRLYNALQLCAHMNMGLKKFSFLFFYLTFSSNKHLFRPYYTQLCIYNEFFKDFLLFFYIVAKILLHHNVWILTNEGQNVIFPSSRNMFLRFYTSFLSHNLL